MLAEFKEKIPALPNPPPPPYTHAFSVLKEQWVFLLYSASKSHFRLTENSTSATADSRVNDNEKYSKICISFSATHLFPSNCD